MDLLPGWSTRLTNIPPVSGQSPFTSYLPKAPSFYAQQITFISDTESAQAMVELAQQRPLSHIGFDTEYGHDRSGVVVKKNQVIQDPRSIRPLLLSLALVETRQEGDGRIYPFVIDLRRQEVRPAIKCLFYLPIRFVAHFSKGDFFCLWQLGISEPKILWDTWVHEKCQLLGLYHPRNKSSGNSDEGEEPRVQEEMRELEKVRLSLVSTCHRNGIVYGMQEQKKNLQVSFLTHDKDAPFTPDQIQYAAEDAIAVAKLYPYQILRAVSTGVLHHLETIEMPWTITNARMEWQGVRISANARDHVAKGCVQHLPILEKQLEPFGISNARSHPQLEHFFEKEGLLPLFRKHGKYSFDKDQLKLFRDRHPSIPLIRAIRQMHDLRVNPLLAQELIGQDGRVHPEYLQLGADTGRQTSKNPNILGLHRALRPLIIPANANGIGEVDWAQIEVGIAAAVYQDDQLTEMFNTGDVYSAMAQRYFHDQLSLAEQTLSGMKFKKKFPHFRDHMKTCTLGIIYGMTAQGLANALNTSVSKAAAFQKYFSDMFPTLYQALTDAIQFGTLRGYTHTHNGLRRYRGRTGLPSFWEKNWLKNHPVQGSAAVLFKIAGNRLDKLYQPYHAHLIIPLHDAYIFEAPLAALGEVANLTARVMCETVQEAFPTLRPRVEINISHPECWNKDGDVEALTRWLENPLT